MAMPEKIIFTPLFLGDAYEINHFLTQVEKQPETSTRHKPTKITPYTKAFPENPYFQDKQVHPSLEKIFINKNKIVIH